MAMLYRLAHRCVRLWDLWLKKAALLIIGIIGTTQKNQNHLEATLPKLISACVQLLHPTLSTYLLPYYLSKLVQAYFWPIYTLQALFSLSHLASHWQLADLEHYCPLSSILLKTI